MFKNFVIYINCQIKEIVTIFFFSNLIILYKKIKNKNKIFIYYLKYKTFTIFIISIFINKHCCF